MAAISILKTKGVTIATSSDSTKLVGLQDRLISLMCDALIYIKRYADKAFEQEYYDQYYADQVKQSRPSTSPEKELESAAVA